MRILTILLVLCFVLAMAGCSNRPTEPDPQASVFPGPKLTPPMDEDPPAVVVEAVPDDVLIILEENTPEGFEEAPAFFDPPPWDDLTNVDVYAVTFIWGNFFGMPTPTSVVTDWSGTLSVNGVANVQVRTPIDFEEGEDYIVEENLEAAAEWVSTTGLDFDGISFMVYLRNDVTYITAPLLTFETAPVTLEFDFHDLERLMRFMVLDNGNALAIHARRIWPHHCPGGMFRGEWVSDGLGSGSGHFSGPWLNRAGEITGSLAGHYWTTADGQREWEGWLSGVYLTYVIAEMSGHWWYDDPSLCPVCGEGHGWFRGRFQYVNGGSRGTMVGEFGHMMTPTDEAVLPYHGVWRVNCAYDPNDHGSVTDGP